jgi:hypothetical protein
MPVLAGVVFAFSYCLGRACSGTPEEGLAPLYDPNLYGSSFVQVGSLVVHFGRAPFSLYLDVQNRRRMAGEDEIFSACFGSACMRLWPDVSLHLSDCLHHQVREAMLSCNEDWIRSARSLPCTEYCSSSVYPRQGRIGFVANSGSHLRVGTHAVT